MKNPNLTYVLVCHQHVISMYSYVIRMSLACTPVSTVCHSYVLVCQPYVTRMYSYVVRMSLVCTPMPSVCHSYVVLPWTLKMLVMSLYHCMIAAISTSVCLRLHILKVISATFLLVYFLSLNNSTFQTRKNVFYFTAEALFVLEKIKF